MKRITMTMCALGALAACGEPPPPPSVAEYMEDPILLEATMVLCSQNRAATRYEGECVNARSAVDQLAAAEEETRRRALEAESEWKRRALRHAQEAAAEARRRAAEEAKRREEAAYFGQFEPLPPAGEQPQSEGPAPAAATGHPAATVSPEGADLDSVREELKRRQDEAEQ